MTIFGFEIMMIKQNNK